MTSAEVSLQVLEELTQVQRGRQERLTTLLRPPDTGPSEGWAMYVPPCFNDSLDIRLTIRATDGGKALTWTQGAAFSFGVGDVLYDTPEAYEMWADALKKISLCVQVTLALPATPSGSENGRFPGSVTFNVLRPNEAKNKLVVERSHAMSQDDFVRFLITGKPMTSR